MYSPEGKDTGKNLDFRELDPQRINKMLAKDLRHTRNGLMTRLIRRAEFEEESSSSHEPSSSQDPTFIFIFIFSLLFISSDCYYRNDVQVVNRKINFQVWNIFHYRSLEPLPLGFTAAAERYN